MLLSYWPGRGTRSSAPSDSGGSGGATGPQVTDLHGAQQSILASAACATAQGAMGGNIINHDDVARPSPAASALSDPSEERGGQL